MEQRKLRKIKSKQPNAREVYGITIPPIIADQFINTYFKITKSGTSIMLTSGTYYLDTPNFIEGVELEDYEKE